jgi:hypothetical protein
VTAGSNSITGEEAEAIAVEAYIFLYPLVTMEITRRQMTRGEPGARAGRGPMGVFNHIRSFPDADFKVVVRPNFDTLYSTAWLDLSSGPVVVSAPAAGDRYYLLPCLDMWTDVFASPGSRTSGNGPIDFALCPQGWSGSLPLGVERIVAPTPTVWVIGRTQTNGPSDYPAVRAFQDQLTITPLSSWGGEPPPPTVVDDPAIDSETPPLDQVNGMSGADYFDLGAQLMGLHPPHVTDWGSVTRMRRLGISPGAPVDHSALPAPVRSALADAPAAALALLGSQFPRLAPTVNGWMSIHDSMGVYGNFYVKRAVVAMVGLGANQPEDAMYPVLEVDADGKPLDGSNRYVMHMDADSLPPADAFWSVTMYDADGFQAANELDRFAIGDRDDLTYNADGSLDLYLQHDNPGPDRVANWLPAPEGPLGVTMRLYQPRSRALVGDWNPPPVLKAD